MMLLIVAGCSKSEYDDAMEKGKQALNHDNYEEAVGFYEQAVEEKQDDEKAKHYLKQSDKMAEGSSNFEEGHFDKAKEDYDAILQEDDDDAILHKQAQEQINQIKNIEKAYDELKSTYTKAQDQFDDEDYKRALTLIDQSLNIDVDHSYLNDPIDDLHQLKDKVRHKQTKIDDLRTEANKIYERAKNLEKRRHYDRAINIIEDMLSKDLSNQNLIPIREDLKDLKGKLKEKRM